MRWFLALLLLSSCQPKEPGQDPPSPEPSSASPRAPSPPASPLDPAEVAALGLSPDGAKALQNLASARHFGGWAVGAAGSPTPPVIALRQLWKEPKAKEALAMVFTHGTPEGRLMALAGLFDADPPSFAAALAEARKMKGEVALMTSGCAPGGDMTPIAAIVDDPQAARLTGPDDDLAKWAARNPSASLAFDIAGGGYTAVMRPR